MDEIELKLIFKEGSEQEKRTAINRVMNATELCSCIDQIRNLIRNYEKYDVPYNETLQRIKDAAYSIDLDSMWI